MENLRISKTAMYLLRGAAIFAVFFFVRLVMYFMTVGTAMQDNAQMYLDFPTWGISLIVLLGSLFLYNSLVRLFALHDAIGADLFFEKPVVKHRFAEYRDAFRDRYLILTTLSSLLLLSVLLPLGFFPEADLLFEPLGSMKYLAVYAVYFSSFIFTAINSRYETHRHWLQLYESHDTDKVRSRILFIVKCVLISIVYPFAVPMSPVLVFLVINIFSVMKALMGLFSTVGLGIATSLLIIFIVIRPKLRALSVRRKFTKRLIAAADRAGYELSDVEKEKSLAAGYAGAISFNLKYSEHKYSCRLIPIERRGRPIYFTGERNAHFLIKLGGKKHFVSLAKHFNYAPADIGKSIIILSPEPKYVYVSSDGSEKRLFTGDKIWKHTVFETDSFFGALDRHCLEKSNGMFE